MLALIACGTGVYLGLKFNVLALLPISGLGAGAYVVVSWSSGNGLLRSLVLVIIPLVAVQLGYFVGLTARDGYRHLLIRLKLGQSRQA